MGRSLGEEKRKGEGWRGIGSEGGGITDEDGKVEMEERGKRARKVNVKRRENRKEARRSR